ncbi:hypothetical protein CDEST_09612 [Colletotrichum destructivum]|uniref:Uncharacterized protein n=1 Tax=Colletotrichum destructivum TaxID=34406 RepID=A0AAX4INN2_9PEZI|nr:hypothetical protein CDEST_09612 [Colletotrichum destructivum]
MTSSKENANYIDELREPVDGYAWCVLQTDAPDWYMCPIYKTILGEEDAFQAACTSPLDLAPNLLGTLW